MRDRETDVLSHEEARVQKRKHLPDRRPFGPNDPRLQDRRGPGGGGRAHPHVRGRGGEPAAEGGVVQARAPAQHRAQADQEEGFRAWASEGEGRHGEPGCDGDAAGGRGRVRVPSHDSYPAGPDLSHSYPHRSL